MTEPPTHPAYNLLTKTHPPETAQNIYTDKILHKPLLLSTQHDNTRTRRRHLRLHKKAYALKHAKPKPLSAREKRSLKLYDLRPQDCRYEVYKDLNLLWCRYMLEVLGYVDRKGESTGRNSGVGVSAGMAIAGADFHGMEVEVVKCSDVNRVGLRGIVVRETRSTLVVVCNERETSVRKIKALRGDSEDVVDEEQIDKVRMILKAGTVFRVRLETPVGGAVWDLHGTMLETRPTERASKKWKFNWKRIMDTA